MPKRKNVYLSRVTKCSFFSLSPDLHFSLVFSGPYEVEQKVSDRDCVIKAPDSCEKLIHEFKNLLGDVPSQTNVLEHDIDSTPPIKQHPYRVNPTKRAHLQPEVKYM